jgi:DNA polymerase III subunit delta'
MAWSEIPGQELAKRIFRTHLSSGQIAQAYLLAGPEGTGKRALALEMAKTLVCHKAQGEPCGVCQSCGQVDRRTHPDVHTVASGEEAEAIKIQDIRMILERTSLRPFSSRLQAAVILGAEKLTEEAANSLLKSLEEPNSYTRFLLTTGHLGQCLPTIVSRCQVIRCPSPPGAEMSGIADVLRGQLERSPVEWALTSLPEKRQDVIQLVDSMVLRIREDAPSHGPEMVERWVDTAFELIALRDSVERFVNPKLAAHLAREKWLSLKELA